MVEIDWKSPLLKEAVLIWTGWGQEIIPWGDSAALVKHFGAKVASELLPILKSITREFYTSDAKYTAANLVEMGRIASEDFQKKHPEVAEEIVRALA